MAAKQRRTSPLSDSVTQGNLMTKHTYPSVRLTSFNCPHCGAFSAQHWHALYTSRIAGLPTFPLDETLAEIQKELHHNINRQKERMDLARRQVSTEPVLAPPQAFQVNGRVLNAYLSRCEHCEKVSLWSYHTQVVPASHTIIEPNADLDDDIKEDFREAVGIVDRSPRGAAALLRLALQKLCKQLGESGENINEDIASLVVKGLDKDMEIALDTVRMIGNETVHPGTIDLRDNREIAILLFEIINSIAYQMITHKNKVRALYQLLPPEKLKGIEDRNKGAIAKAEKEKQKPHT